MTEQEARWLGRQVSSAQGYAPDLLTPLTRRRGSTPGIAGEDIWNAYELCWRDATGQQRHHIAEIRIPADSPRLVESKSLKLYLNGFEYLSFHSQEEVTARIAADLQRITGALPEVHLARLDDLPLLVPLAELARALAWQPDSAFCALDEAGSIPAIAQSVVLYSDAMKSNCPVTGQPDWASVVIALAGRPFPEPARVSDWLAEKRVQQDFHETCVESLFDWLRAECPAAHLLVYARYTRRGGIDINPWRASALPRARIPNWRLPRQ